LKHGTAPRVGNTIDSALKYCRELLEPAGTCESLLPSTYSVWKISSEIECGAPQYDSFTYTNPGSGVEKSLLKVDYSTRQEYALAQEFWFGVYKSIVLFTWLLLMFVEFKEVQKIVTVVMRYPDAGDFGEDAVLMEQDPSDPEDVRFRIQGITSSHRRNIAFLCVLRLGITASLLFVGMSYIVKTNGYADLLMNGVTLFFVAEIASLLYAQVLREEIRDQCEDIKPMKVQMYGWVWLNRRPALLDMFCVIFLSLCVVFVMQWQMDNVVKPVYESLSCTCVGVGETCKEAQVFNKGFWDTYWMKTGPDVFKELDALKSTVPAAAIFAAQPTHAGNFASSISDYISTKELDTRVHVLQSNHNHLEHELDALMKAEVLAKVKAQTNSQYEKSLHSMGSSASLSEKQKKLLP